MNDIKKLEKLVEHKNDYDSAFGTKIHRPYTMYDEDWEVLENIIARLKDLEQIEKEHKEENGRLREEIDNKDNTIEQLQKEAGYKKCKLCKKVFKAKRKNQIYCSERCCNIVMCRNYKRRNRDKILTYAKEYYKKMKSNKVEEDK